MPDTLTLHQALTELDELRALVARFVRGTRRADAYTVGGVLDPNRITAPTPEETLSLRSEVRQAHYEAQEAFARLHALVDAMPAPDAVVIRPGSPSESHRASFGWDVGPSDFGPRGIIGTPEVSHTGNLVLRCGRENPHVGGGWTQTSHAVLTPAEAAELLASIEHEMSPSPAVGLSDAETEIVRTALRNLSYATHSEARLGTILSVLDKLPPCPHTYERQPGFCDRCGEAAPTPCPA